MSVLAHARQAITRLTHPITRLLAIGALLAMAGAQPSVAGAQPNIPQPVPVELDPATTAYLVLDITDTLCAPRASCTATVPAIAALLDRARAAGAHVIYSVASTGAVMPEVAPRDGEPTIQSRADKFFNTHLDELLHEQGVRTLVIVGTAANGAVLYTTFEANLRGYTAVVAEDGISADDPFAVLLTRYQLLHQPGLDNPNNDPLLQGRVTLSRTDLIAFR